MLLGGILVSAFGDRLAAIALALFAAQIGNAGFLAAVLLADAVPAICLAIVGGIVADRYLRWWWPSGLALQAICYSIMGLSGHPSILIAGILILSTTNSTLGPVSMKMLTAVSPGVETKSAKALATIQGLAGILGVVAGAVGMQWAPVSILLFVNAGTFGTMTVVALLVADRDLNSAVRSRRLQGGVFGFQILSRPDVFGVSGVALIGGTVLATSLESVSGVFVLTGFVGLSNVEYGIVVVAWAVGIIVGSRFASPEKRVLLLGAPSVAMGLVFLMVVWMPLPTMVVGMVFLLGGFANGVINAQIASVLMSCVALDAQGRAWAAFRWMVNVGLIVGYVVAGAAAADKAREVVAVSGALAVGVGVIYTIAVASKALGSAKMGEVSVDDG